ncbi:MAG: glycosyltransferase 87 family protein [Candidatus Tectimicrobiota bacterium]
MLQRPRVRVCLLGLLGGVSVCLYAQEFTIATYLWVFVPLCGLYGLALGVVFGRSAAGAPGSLALIVVFAVLFRLLVVASPLILSSDLYRYVWDGRVQRAGINPYRYAPEAEALAGLRDTAIYPQVHRPALPTIYPPVAQMLFALITALVPDSVRGMKQSMLCFDLITLVLIILLLKRTGQAPERVLLYAWSPLVVFEFAGSGHVDVLMLPLLLLALLARLAQWPALAGVLLGLATLTKLYPAVVFPALYQRAERRFPLGFAITLVLGYGLYLPGAGSQVFGYLPGYFGPWEDFNGGLRSWLTLAFMPLTEQARLLAAAVCALLLLVVAYRVHWRVQESNVLQCAGVMIAAYLLLVPTTFHPWYVIWLLPCLCVRPLWGWLYLSGAIALSYVAYTLEYPTVPLPLHLLEFVPCYGLLLLQRYWPSLRRLRTQLLE